MQASSGGTAVEGEAMLHTPGPFIGPHRVGAMRPIDAAARALWRANARATWSCCKATCKALFESKKKLSDEGRARPAFAPNRPPNMPHAADHRCGVPRTEKQGAS
jgi:hypothetical protein